ncbi:hypothetical protein IWW46_001241 [Coemansia sp. RSA 2440]|nr:hypothetical protein IWW46_001241 [Coemansia sp. RSA 2440]
MRIALLGIYTEALFLVSAITAVAMGLAEAADPPVFGSGAGVVVNTSNATSCTWDGVQELDDEVWKPAASYAFRGRSNETQGPGNIDRDIMHMVRRLSVTEKIGQMTQVQVGLLLDCNGELNETAVKHWINTWKIGSFLESPGNHNGRYSWYSPQKFSELTDAVQRIALENGPKIPVLWGLDSVRGANYVKGATIFPAGIATAATFDADHAFAAGRVASKDSRAAGTHWAFAPVLDIAVNKLWSRTYENFGEDPFLSAQMGRASVQGYQGDYKSDRTRVAACLKHFIGYGYPFDGSDRANRHIAAHELLEYYVPPFRAAIEAGSATAMESYGVVNGEAIMLSHYYLTQLLRKQLGFEGMLVTDWGEINSQDTLYRTAKNVEEATKLALQQTSVDMSMVADDASFGQTMLDLVANGTLSEERLDESVARVLQLKKDLGLFTDPFADPQLATTVGSLQDVNAARDAVRESVTLLKNENNVLPLKVNDKVLFVGPTLDSTRLMGGGWNVHWQGPSNEDGDAVYQGFGDTILRGVRQVTGKAPKYMQGVDIDGEALIDIDNVVRAASKADKVVVGLGEHTYAENGGNIGQLLLPEKHIELVSAIANQTNTPVVVVLVQGRPRGLGTIAQNAAAILNAYLPGAYGGLPIAELLYGRVSPSGRLPTTYPATEAQASATIWQSSYGEYAPQWAFGYGLGYSNITYSNVTLSHSDLQMGAPVTVSVTVTNHGPHVQKEVVQLYTHQQYRMGYAPELFRLRGFTKVNLNVGASETVSFVLTAEEMAFWDRKLRRRIEPAPVTVAINPFIQKDISAVVQLRGDPGYVLEEADY